MGDEINAKVRIVRCPKCLQVLQEPSDIPVYKCGGCSTVLQAKKRKNHNTNLEPCTGETTPVKNEQPQNSVEKELNGPQQEATISPHGDTLKGNIIKTNEDRFGNYSREQHGDENSRCDELSSIREPFEQSGDESHLSPSLDSSSKLTGETELKLKSHETSLPFCPPAVGEGVGDDIGACQLESPESQVCTEAANQSPINDSISSENVTPSHHRINPGKEISPGFDRGYYAYYGSASSCDGDDETNTVERYSQHYGQRLVNRRRLGDKDDEYVDKVPLLTNCHGSPSTYKKSDFIPSSSIVTGPERDRIELLKTIHELEDQIQKMRLQTREDETGNMERYLQENGQRVPHATGNRRWLDDRDEYVKKDPFFMNSMNCHGSPSTRRISDLNPSSSMVTDIEPDRIELLNKMIYELEQQIHKIHLRHGNPNNMFHSTPAQMSKVPFSGEVSHCLPCSHCCPPSPVWHWSGQLPRGCISGDTLCSPSPRRSSVNDHKKVHLREMYAKRCHFLPVAGGAPIIACYYCSKLLRIPADFGLFRRRFHRLRCNVCKNILKFLVQDGKHVIPYFAEVVAPPPSEDDDSSTTIDETFESARRSFKKSLGRKSSSGSDEEGELDRTSSPLHRLMGYSSVSQVVNR
ncbi:unnamed protein product [Cuscuta epithymum]|uniref:Zinc-ribbon domain-containing protein n=2 Tax=Cuscuta epithymum TaxID=186058 RepID=A0AAV0ETA0_9ASTE|nr:unnamed protein product [Cuscuta epithymum]